MIKNCSKNTIWPRVCSRAYDLEGEEVQGFRCRNRVSNVKVCVKRICKEQPTPNTGRLSTETHLRDTLSDSIIEDPHIVMSWLWRGSRGHNGEFSNVKISTFQHYLSYATRNSKVVQKFYHTNSITVKVCNNRTFQNEL
jgi:hypothetical protein